MSSPTSALTASRSARGSVLAGPTREPPYQSLRDALQVGRERERRVRAQARWQRFVSACQNELLRRDAEPGCRR